MANMIEPEQKIGKITHNDHVHVVVAVGAETTLFMHCCVSCCQYANLGKRKREKDLLVFL